LACLYAPCLQLGVPHFFGLSKKEQWLKLRQKVDTSSAIPDVRK
jgi:hypothetical protein